LLPPAQTTYWLQCLPWLRPVFLNACWTRSTHSARFVDVRRTTFHVVTRSVDPPLDVALLVHVHRVDCSLGLHFAGRIADCISTSSSACCCCYCCC
jgi:hypothetical protein